MTQSVSESLIVHGGRLNPQEELSEASTQSMDTAIAARQSGVAPNLVATGGHFFMVHDAPSISEAEAMKRYAVEHGVPIDAILTEDESLDTIGNALFTKTGIVVPNGWEHLTVVTSVSRLPRSLRIFKHVYGSDFEINGIPAPENTTFAIRIYEKLGSAMLDEVFKGTKPGDDEAIKERLFDLVPGYADGTMPKLVAKTVIGLVKPNKK